MKCLQCGGQVVTPELVCSKSCGEKWEALMEKGTKAWADVPDLIEEMDKRVKLADSLCDEIIKIATTGILPDGDHVPTHVMNWFCEWTKRIEGVKA